MDSEKIFVSTICFVVGLAVALLVFTAYKKEVDPCQRVCSMYEIKNPVQCLQQEVN